MRRQMHNAYAAHYSLFFFSFFFFCFALPYSLRPLTLLGPRGAQAQRGWCKTSDQMAAGQCCCTRGTHGRYLWYKRSRVRRCSLHFACDCVRKHAISREATERTASTADKTQQANELRGDHFSRPWEQRSTATRSIRFACIVYGMRGTFGGSPSPRCRKTRATCSAARKYYAICPSPRTAPTYCISCLSTHTSSEDTDMMAAKFPGTGHQAWRWV